MTRATAREVQIEQQGPRTFQRLDDGYELSLPDVGLTFTVTHLRRESHALTGELVVSCNWPAARTVNGALSAADFNLSSARARVDRARHLEQRSQASDLDWVGLIEELSQQVILAERAGEPALKLSDVQPTARDSVLPVHGLPLLQHHATMVFGDGGSTKSLLAIWAAGDLVQRGVRVGLFDWELNAEDHHERLAALFGPANVPGVVYARCDRPLIHEVDRLRRIVREEDLQYAVLDSVAYGCAGPPEAAESAMSYFRSLRQLQIGSLLLAHVTKSDDGDRRPFGSAFWHNSARATWFIKAAEQRTADQVTVGLYPRKFNLGAMPKPLAYEWTFDPDRIDVRRIDMAGVEDLAAGLPLWQRLRSAVRHGPRTLVDLSGELGANVESLDRTVRRHRGVFTRVDGRDGVSRVALLDRGVS